MSNEEKRLIFEQLRCSQDQAGLSTAEREALLCPLCWKETPYAFLTLEHVVPGAVGGRPKTLTCRRCNNGHGTALDAHLARFQATNDVFEGHGSIPGTMTVRGKTVAINLEWSEAKNIHIAGRASHPTRVESIREDFENGRVEEVHLSLSLGYGRNALRTALLRAAYLALFRSFGYEYAQTAVVQQLRMRILDLSLPRPDLRTLTAAVKNLTGPIDDRSYLIVPAKLGDIPFLQVVIRLRKRAQTYHAVFMPATADAGSAFFQAFEDLYERAPGFRMSGVRPEAIIM